MRSLRIFAAALIGAAALAFAPSPAQAVDRGDQKAACNSGEICFQWIWDSFSTSTFQRHFWYSDSNHTNDTWGNVPDLYPVLDFDSSAKGIYNRDTECSVTLYASTGYRNGYATIARTKRQSISAWNQSHKRCP
ncbi:hypothetical protein [Actinoplanes sp. NBRC 101535]|uniref:hypothetical protein n=1 Tax=Actinoplanes sp. NBRC 101535 TaxID=3032196 RepID=UPI0024A35334|nr:hypothetical protein [Actinoplanes sp. NBRC 101535]GLY07730.1 hypothetical protein Acsp01_81090 [Actinoplanes sp. NBRC 101535]